MLLYRFTGAYVFRRFLSAANLTPTSLGRAITEAYERTDLRWLLPFALFRSEQVPQLDVKSALSELAEVGLIAAGGVELTEAGSLFIDDLMDRKAIVDVSSLYQQDSALARSQVMFIRTEQSLWAVQFGDQDTAVLSLTIDEACELMVSLLIQKDEPTDRPASQITQAVSPAEAKTEVINCSKCGQTLAPAAKFCVHCGAPAPLPIAPKTAVFCKYCGAKLIPGKHFCAKCGNHAINNYLRSIIKRALEIIKGLIEQKNDERIWHWLSRKVVKKSADGYQRYLNR